MPRAGFWAVGGYTISFRRDGFWYADEERIANPRIQLLFSRGIRRDDRENASTLPRYTGWLLDVGVDRQPVTIEDTPLVVVAIDGDCEGGFLIRTNDEVSGALECASLRIGEGDVLYCEVEREARGRLRARFVRAAYYRLAEFVEWEGQQPVLRCQGQSYSLTCPAVAVVSL